MMNVLKVVLIIVALMLHALILLVPTTVRVTKDTPEMEPPVKVCIPITLT